MKVDYTTWHPPLAEEPPALWGVAVAALLLYYAMTMAPFHYGGADSRFILLVSEALWERGTTTLDHYVERGELDPDHYAIRAINGHHYYVYPLGTSLLSVPFVAMERLAGKRMVVDHSATQQRLAALSCSAMLLALYALARLFLPPLASGGLALVWGLGSSLVSSLGTTLLSHNFAVLFALLALYGVALRLYRGGNVPVWSLGLALFLAYLCRPTMAVLTPLFMGLLLWHHQVWAALGVGIWVGLGLLALGGYAWLAFAAPLPPYYLPGLLAFADPGALEVVNFTPQVVATDPKAPPLALYIHLLSPARGVLIYWPQLWLLPLALFLWPHLPARALGAMALGWVVVQLGVLVSPLSHGFGGHAYGPRLMVDALPGVYVLSVITAKAVGDGGHGWRRGFWGGMALTGTIAIYFNLVQGVFNPYTQRWNEQPDIDYNLDYLGDWRYPPFWYDERRHEERLVRHLRRRPPLAPVAPGEVMDHRSSKVRFVGWSYPEMIHRWSEGHHAALILELAPGAAFEGRLALRAWGLGDHRVEVYVGGQPLAQWQLTRGEVGDYSATLPPDALAGETLVIAFRTPDALPPDAEDQRSLSMALMEFSLH
ncbi:MAG: hypothetical protein ACFCBW_05300 [Candidatus Competibacterales bacterium]